MTDTKAEELMPVTLKACPNPWCLSHQPERYNVRGVHTEKSLDGYIAKCADCGLKALWKYSKAEADEAWNHRIDSQAELVAQLEETQRVFALLIDPEAIKSTTVLNAFAQVTAAEAETRALLARLGTPS